MDNLPIEMKHEIFRRMKVSPIQLDRFVRENRSHRWKVYCDDDEIWRDKFNQTYHRNQPVDGKKVRRLANFINYLLEQIFTSIFFICRGEVTKYLLLYQKVNFSFVYLENKDDIVTVNNIDTTNEDDLNKLFLDFWDTSFDRIEVGWKKIQLDRNYQKD